MSEDDLQFLIELSKELGRLVKDLADMPRLKEHLEMIWRGFFLLSSGSRPLGFSGVGPIPLSAYLDFLAFEDVRDKDTQDEYIRHWRKMDTIYLKHITDKSNKEKEGAEDGSSYRNRRNN